MKSSRRIDLKVDLAVRVDSPVDLAVDWVDLVVDLAARADSPVGLAVDPAAPVVDLAALAVDLADLVDRDREGLEASPVDLVAPVDLADRDGVA